jgi:hypothetical protein
MSDDKTTTVQAIVTTTGSAVHQAFWGWYTDDGQGADLSDDFVLRIRTDDGRLVVITDGSVRVDG